MFAQIQEWLQTLPPLSLYLVVGLIIGVESMGIPLPGEITLVTASVIAATTDNFSPWGVAIGAAIGAIVGDSIGYTIGRRGGIPLIERLGRRFPKHLGPDQIERAEGMFAKWGVWAVFFGRFIALLRILAGPLAGALKVPYQKFLLANASGGIVWAFGTVFAIYAVGEVAGEYFEKFSKVALIVALVAGIGTTWLIKRRAKKALHSPADTATALDAPDQNAPDQKLSTQDAQQKDA